MHYGKAKHCKRLCLALSGRATQGNPTLPHNAADRDTAAGTFGISLSPARYQNK